MRRHVGRDELRQHDVVGIEQHDVGAARHREALHGGHRLSRVGGSLDDAQGGEAAHQLGEHREAVVGRLVVEHDAFDVGIGLREDRLDRGTDEARVVVVDHDDADERQPELEPVRLEPRRRRGRRFVHRPAFATRASARRA